MTTHSVIRLFDYSIIRKTRSAGFTLVELIIVVGIICILMGVLVANFSGSTESARAAKCLSNLRNMAMAWNGERAGSQEHLSMKMQRNGGVKKSYYELKGWISSATEGLYPSESHQNFEPIGMYEADTKRVDFAISNGWMYAAQGNSRSALVCPSHQKKYGKKKQINWSYFMNAACGWDACRGGYTYIRDDSGCLIKSYITNADRLLLFAEIPYQGPGDWFPDGDGGSLETDAILQFDGCNECSTALGKSPYNGQENIGGNHKTGKYWMAHVAFADGHVEKLRVDNLTGENLKELTTWLCQGKAIGLNNGRYEEIK